MSIDLLALATILLLMRTSAVLLYVWMGVRGCGWPRSSSVLRIGTSVLVFKNNAPSYASAADDITLQMIVDRSRTAQLFGVFICHLIVNCGLLRDCVHYFRTGKMHRNGLPVPHHWH